MLSNFHMHSQRTHKTKKKCLLIQFKSHIPTVTNPDPSPHLNVKEIGETIPTDATIVVAAITRNINIGVKTQDPAKAKEKVEVNTGINPECILSSHLQTSKMSF